MPFHRLSDSRSRSWVHTHTFEELDGGTLVRDRVEYSVLGGSITNRFFVRAELRRIFNYRHAQLPDLLGVCGDDCDRGEVRFSTEQRAAHAAVEM